MICGLPAGLPGAGGVPAFRRVLVETTGLADPIPILEVLAAHPDVVAEIKAGKDRKQAIYAAYDRFYKGDVAEELVRAVFEFLLDLVEQGIGLARPRAVAVDALALIHSLVHAGEEGCRLVAKVWHQSTS